MRLRVNAKAKLNPDHRHIPSANFERVLREGIDALGRVEADIAARTNVDDSQDRWLELRDVRGLRGRLTDSESEEWREGSVQSVLSPLDIAVLERCEAAYAHLQVAPALRALRRFLCDYIGT